ncbi:MAG: exo-alpha-sialidase [bacterium]|nr:exo-alpha-sialidase [bacterium]
MTSARQLGLVIALGAVGAIVVCSAAPVLAAMTWADAQPLNTNAPTDTDSDYYMDWARDDVGNWVMVWCAAIPGAQDRDFDIFVSRSSDFGAFWTAPVLLDPLGDTPPEIEDDFHPTVVTDRAGHWVAAWYTHDNRGATIGDDTDILVSTSADNGLTWTPSTPMNSDAATDTTGDSTPSIATDGNGLWVAVWHKKITDLGDYDMYTIHSTDNGQTWTPLALLHPSFATDTGYDGSPSITTDEAGHWVVVWRSDDPLGGSIDVDDDILVSCSTDGLTWTAPAALNSTATTDTLDDKIPQIATDRAGRWVTVWYYGIYEVDYDILFSYSDDNGVTWAPADYLNNNALTDSGRDLYPELETDGNGNWVVLWQSKEPIIPMVGTDYDVFFAYSADNAVHWSDPWFFNSFAWEPADSSYDRDPVIAYAGNGVWRAGWGSNFNLDGVIGAEYDLLTSSATLVPDGDQDADGNVDLYDWGGFQRCFAPAGPVALGCSVFDSDGDDDVDLDDYVQFEAALGGPN